MISVEDGNDCGQLLAAYEQAAAYTGKPTAVIAHTVKGKGVSFMEDNKSWHHGVMKKEQYEQAVMELEARRAELSDFKNQARCGKEA